MNRHEFINELKKKLRNLPYDEIKEAIDYYEGYFDDAGVENEQAVLTELGAPSAVASQIIASFAIKEADAEGSGKKSWRSSWFVILALFASPVAVPLLIAVGVVAIALIISFSAVILSFFVTGVALIAGGLVSTVTGFLVIFQSVPTTFLYLGIGLMLLGIGTAITIATVALSGKCFGWLTKFVGGFIIKWSERRSKTSSDTTEYTNIQA